MTDAQGDWSGAADDDTATLSIKPLGTKMKRNPSLSQAEVGDTDGQKEEAADEEYHYPDKLLLFKHWIRPKFLPYKCLYEYRKNYYDDILEVLASRRRGLHRDIPPAQTWAERLCRLRSHPVYKLDAFDRHLEDIKFVTRTEISGSFHSYYSKEQVNRRFSKFVL